MNLRELVEKDLEYQERMEKFFVEELQVLPNGSLYNKRGTREYYFIESKSRKRTYISKNNLSELEKIRKGKAYRIGLKRCKENIKVAKQLLGKYKDIDFEAVVASLPKAYQFEKDIKREKQKVIEFEGSLLHPTSRGLRVRSKSEVIIAERLDAEGLAYEYEQELILKDFNGRYKKIIPEFIFFTATGDKIYWEHFGLFKDYTYSKRSFEKLLLYAHNDILPGSNLFITAESFEGKIDVSSIYNTIEMIKALL